MYLFQNTMQVIVLILLLGLPVTTAIAQPLKTGDEVPTIMLETADATTLDLTKTGKKLVILQFWNTRCGGCIRSLANIDSLQKQFASDILFILITQEDSQVVTKLFDDRKKLVRPAVVYINNDTLLEKYFPHQFVPHHVWLDEGKRIIAITNGNNTTARSITQWLQEKKVNVPETRHMVIADWDRFPIKPAFDTVNKEFSQHSILRTSIDSILPTSSRRKVNGSLRTNRIIEHKATPIDLLLTAYNLDSDKYSLRYGNVELRMSDSVKMELEQQKYLYDLLVPPSRSADLFVTMQQDILKTFGFIVHTEKRRLKCFVLRRTNNQDKLATKGGLPDAGYRKAANDTVWSFRNIPFSRFIKRVSDKFKYEGKLFFDETGYKGNVDISLPASLIKELDVEILNKNLNRYDLGISEILYEVDVLVISKK